MPWVRLDEEFPDHPKVVTAGPLAGWLHVCALAYCNRHLTDGFIPYAQVGRLVNFAGIIELYEDPGPMDARDLPDVSPYELAARLVTLGIWEQRQGGFAIHDFLDYQPSRAEIEAQRKVKKDAGRAGGIRSGESRRSKPEAEPQANGKQKRSRPGSRNEPEAEAEPQANGQAKSKPDPDPDPLVYRSSSSNSSVGAASDEEEELQNRRTTAVGLVAERQLANRLARTDLPPVSDRPSWLKSARAKVWTDHGAELDTLAAQGLPSKAIADRLMPTQPGPYAGLDETPKPAWSDDDLTVDDQGNLVVRIAG